MKGEKARTKSTVEGEVHNSVSDGAWVYIWREGQSEGMKFNIAEMEDLGDEDTGSQGFTDMGEVAKAAVNVDCRPAALSDSMFKPPGDVDFKDMGELMKQMKQMQAQLEGGEMPDLSGLKG